MSCLAAGVICLRPSPLYDPPPPTPALTHCIRVYIVLIHTGKGGGELTREKGLEGQQFTKIDIYLI
jgi:hypothetical protein